MIAGLAVNLCLGVPFAWSVWARALTNEKRAGQTDVRYECGLDLSVQLQAALPFSVAVFTAALGMNVGLRLKSPKVGAIAGGLCLALGCLFAGFSKRPRWLVPLLWHSGRHRHRPGLRRGNVGSLPVVRAPAAGINSRPPHQRLRRVGVFSFPVGCASVESGGLTSSFYKLGQFFAVVSVAAGSFMSRPPDGYRPPPAAKTPLASVSGSMPATDCGPGAMVRSWQFYALVIMLLCSSQSGLMIFAHASNILGSAAKDVPFLVANLWMLPSFAGLAMALGALATPKYSARLGLKFAYHVNGAVSALSLFLMPWIADSGMVFLLFLLTGIICWQFGGGLVVLPSFTAEFYGLKNLKVNYGLVFLGWGLSFFMAGLAAIILDKTISLGWAYWLSAVMLLIGVLVSGKVSRPLVKSNTSYSS